MVGVRDWNEREVDFMVGWFVGEAIEGNHRGAPQMLAMVNRFAWADRKMFREQQRRTLLEFICKIEHLRREFISFRCFISSPGVQYDEKANNVKRGEEGRKQRLFRKLGMPDYGNRQVLFTDGGCFDEVDFKRLKREVGKGYP